MTIKLVQKIDDGKGREFKFSPQEKPEQPKILTEIEDWKKLQNPGEYAFHRLTIGLDCLILVCPFCGFEAPMPWLLTIVSKNPLEVAEELQCRKCSIHFYILKGYVSKSWLPGGLSNARGH